MTDVLPLLQILAAMALLVGPPVLLARLLAGSGEVRLSDLLRMRPDPPRPLGVQEEDQPAFRFDRWNRERGPIAIQPDRREALRVSSTCADERAA